MRWFENEGNVWLRACSTAAGDRLPQLLMENSLQLSCTSVNKRCTCTHQWKEGRNNIRIQMIQVKKGTLNSGHLSNEDSLLYTYTAHVLTYYREVYINYI